jgi:hypothetical protein
MDLQYTLRVPATKIQSQMQKRAEHNGEFNHEEI